MIKILCIHKAPVHNVIVCSQGATKMQPVLIQVHCKADFRMALDMQEISWGWEQEKADSVTQV